MTRKGRNPGANSPATAMAIACTLPGRRTASGLSFADKYMKLNLVSAETGEAIVIDQGEYDDGWERWGIQDYVWSPDSRWVAYTKMEQSLNESIFLYSMAGKSGPSRHRLRTYRFQPVV